MRKLFLKNKIIKMSNYPALNTLTVTLKGAHTKKKKNSLNGTHIFLHTVNTKQK